MPTITPETARLHGYPKNKWFLQTILFNKKKFTSEKAKEWLKANGYYHDFIRYTPGFIRCMQTNPVLGSEYITIFKTHYIELVYQKFH